MTLTNVTNVSLPIAVWLAADDYDFTPGDKAISATSLLKPLRQIILRGRLTEEHAKTPDVSDFIASRLGSSIHDGIERAWNGNYQKSLRDLGYPDSLIKKVRVNPPEDTDDILPIWIEQRTTKDFLGYRISGKFDMVIEGVLQDFKSTSVYSYTMGSKDDDYSKQGSIYRWLNPDKITEDHMNIQFIFTDWSRAMARQSDTYPQQRVLQHRVELMSVDATDLWIRGRIRDLENYANEAEGALPFCTDEELWRSKPVYKFFSNPAKTDGRCTKRLDTMAEAIAYQAGKGKGGGVIHTIPGQVKACNFCPAFPICTQKDLYDHG